jgi:hypothetical protein
VSAEREGDLSLSRHDPCLSARGFGRFVREEARGWGGDAMRPHRGWVSTGRTGRGSRNVGGGVGGGTGERGREGGNADGGWIAGKDFEMSECATTLVELAGRAITAFGRLGLGLVAVGMRAVGPGEAFLS